MITSLIATRANDNSINSLLNANLGSDFDNAKNLYQTFYLVICTELLLVNKQASQELLVKLKNPRCPYLLEIVTTTLIHASKGFSCC